MILDIGCGEKPEGDINLDISKHVQIGPTSGIVKSKCNIIADALHLPFRDKSIEIVYSSHCIEHVKNPCMFVKECERIAIQRIVIKCPSKWMVGNRGNKLHKYTITIPWLRAYGYSVQVSWIYYPGWSPFRILRADELQAIKELK